MDYKDKKTKEAENYSQVYLEYEKFMIDYKFYLPSLSSAAINIDLIVAFYILNNKKLIEKCFYDHPLLSYVLDVTNYQNSLALYIKSPGPNDTLPLNYVRNIFSGVSGESIISKLKKVPELCLSLDDCQKTTIKDYLLELQSSKLVKSISNEFNPIIDYLYDQFSINEGHWVAEPVHIIMTATTNYLDQPDIWATINIDGISYEIFYGEVSGMPYDPDLKHIEGDHRKLFRLGVCGKKLFLKHIREQYPHGVNRSLIRSLVLVPIPLLWFYKRRFQFMFLDQIGNLYWATSFPPVEIPIEISQKSKFENFALNVINIYVVLKNIVQEIQNSINKIENNIQKGDHMSLEDSSFEELFSSPKISRTP
nr:6520_t:CDS:2 [Entrophospora candida]